MKTVGDLLKAAREKHQLSIDQISAYTKISKKYLLAIEDNDFRQLPSAAFSKGFLHTYASIVGLNPKTILAVFRRDFDQDNRGRIIPRSLTDPIRPASVGLTPNKITLLLTLAISLIILSFFIIQIINFSSRPPLIIDEPLDHAILISPIAIRGSTDAQAVVTVNNKSILVGPTGDFSTQIDLTPGQHTLIISATSRSQKKIVLERIVNIQSVP